MTVSDILTDAKKRAGLSEDDQVLLRWCNQEYDETNLLIAGIAPGFFFTTGSIAIVASTHTYDLPSDFSRSLKIEDETESLVPKVDPLDEEKPDGWYFAGSVITAGVRSERIRVQPTPGSAKTWSLFYIKKPVALDTTTNILPDWPDGTHEILVLGILLRWMETEEEDERYAEYKSLRKEKRQELFDLITDRHEGTEPGVVVKHGEDFD